MKGAKKPYPPKRMIAVGIIERGRQVSHILVTDHGFIAEQWTDGGIMKGYQHEATDKDHEFMQEKGEFYGKPPVLRTVTL